ncbi:MAG: peptidase M4, partial [Rhodanobacter sp.]
MIKRLLPLLIGLSVCGAAAAQTAPAPRQSATSTVQTTTTTTWTAQAPAGALNEKAIKTAIGNAGYKEVKGLKFKDGVWRSKARGGNDKW